MDIDRLISNINVYREAFDSLSIDKAILLDSLVPLCIPKDSRVVLYKFRRPLSAAPLIKGAETNLLFGKAVTLSTINLHFAYVFWFPQCEIVEDNLYIAAVRTRREKYIGSRLQLCSGNMVVVGNADSTAIIRKSYDLLPEFENI